MIKIEGYLTQTKLAEALKQIIGTACWIGEEFPVPGTRRRWDMAYKSINNDTVVVEFDGDSHYRDSLVIRADKEKDEIAKKLGYITIRIPYWVQLTKITAHYYFNVDVDIDQNFPHGFIKTKIFPASFCKMGLERFGIEFRLLPAQVQREVIKSLHDRSEEYGGCYVNETIKVYGL